MQLTAGYSGVAPGIASVIVPGLALGRADRRGVSGHPVGALLDTKAVLREQAPQTPEVPTIPQIRTTNCTLRECQLWSHHSNGYC